MTRYAALLRGVNVGGINIKMADLARVLADTGFDNVRTVLASGNVLLDSPSEANKVRLAAERALREAFGYEAWVLVYTLDTLARISAAYPFQREVEGHHSYVTFVSDPDVLDELAALPPGQDKVQRGDGVLYWQVARGATLDSTIAKATGKKRYKSSTTTRNLRTLEKMLR